MLYPSLEIVAVGIAGPWRRRKGRDSRSALPFLSVLLGLLASFGTYCHSWRIAPDPDLEVRAYL